MCRIHITMFPQPLGGPSFTKVIAPRSDAREFFFTTRSDERELRSRKAEIKEPAAIRMDHVIVLLRSGHRDYLDLTAIQSNPLIQWAALLALRLGVGKQYFGGA